MGFRKESCYEMVLQDRAPEEDPVEPIGKGSFFSIFLFQNFIPFFPLSFFGFRS